MRPTPDFRAEALLAGLAAEQVRHWTREEGRAATDVRDALLRLIHQLAREH